MAAVLKKFSKRLRYKSELKASSPSKDLVVLPERRMTRDEHLNVHQANSVTLQEGPLYWDGYAHHRHLSQETEEDKTWLEYIQKRLGNCEPDADIDFKTFKHIMEIENEFYAERFFSILDTQKKNFLTVDELKHSLSSLAKGCVCQKLKFIFDIYDADGSGTIDKNEFSAVLTVAIDDNALAISPQQIEHMTNAFFDAVDENKDGVLTFKELKTALDKSPEKITSLKISASRFLKPPKVGSRLDKRTKKKWCECPPYVLTPEYVRRHPVEFWSALIYALSIVAFYLYGSLYAVIVDHHISTERCLPLYAVAHGFGMNLNWNCMLLIVFMLRRTLTFLRNSRLGPFLPFDLAVFIHKVVGWVVGICSLGHFVLHMFHFKCLATTPNATYSYTDLLFTPIHGLGWVPPGIVSITGWVLLFIYIAMFICSLPFVRRSGKFEVFYFTHLFYIPFMIILILHSDKFWKFLIVPGIIFILEKISMSRCVRQLMGNKFYIKDVTMWSSQVMQIVINHPPGFTFNPGDYIFLNIPIIAWFEWHPFTISSCPENLDCITLHIRCVGQWTNRLRSHFQKRVENLEGVKIIPVANPSQFHAPAGPQPSVFYKKRQSARGRSVIGLHIPVYIDGAYGTPTGRIFNSQHAVLICAGIGVTPFASILQSILYRHRADKVRCPDCDHEFSPYTGQSSMLKKVNFIWVVNNQRNIEWFVELLEQIDLEQQKENQLERLIDIQIYVTGAKTMGDLYSFALTTALDVFYEKYSRDMITGIRARPIPGRPDWPSVFKKIHENRRGPVSVFFCGPVALSKTLATLSSENSFRYCKESF